MSNDLKQRVENLERVLDKVIAMQGKLVESQKKQFESVANIRAIEATAAIGMAAEATTIIAFALRHVRQQTGANFEPLIEEVEHRLTSEEISTNEIGRRTLEQFVAVLRGAQQSVKPALN